MVWICIYQTCMGSHGVPTVADTTMDFGTDFMESSTTREWHQLSVSHNASHVERFYKTELKTTLSIHLSTNTVCISGRKELRR